MIKSTMDVRRVVALVLVLLLLAVAVVAAAGCGPATDQPRPVVQVPATGRTPEPPVTPTAGVPSAVIVR